MLFCLSEGELLTLQSVVSLRLQNVVATAAAAATTAATTAAAEAAAAGEADLRLASMPKFRMGINDYDIRR
jgi:hypothetical protein